MAIICLYFGVITEGVYQSLGFEKEGELDVS